MTTCPLLQYFLNFYMKHDTVCLYETTGPTCVYIIVNEVAMCGSHC